MRSALDNQKKERGHRSSADLSQRKAIEARIIRQVLAGALLAQEPAREPDVVTTAIVLWSLRDLELPQELIQVVPFRDSFELFKRQGRGSGAHQRLIDYAAGKPTAQERAVADD